VAFGITTAGVISAAVTPPDAAVGHAVTAPTGEERELAAERADRSERSTAAAPSTGDRSVGLSAPSATEHTSPTERRAMKRPAWVNPMPGVPFTSCYGQRWGALHAGIDFAGPAGQRIRAAGKGHVVSTGWRYPGYGISVLIDHGNGYLTHYAHASRVLVRAGQEVRAGQPIAIEGSTGNSTGPHLHFEVHRGLWNQVDPAAWLRSRGVPIGC
jgi:murein DD-endopeptidase MepM/ murein hydrolase activator NlpD